MQIYKTLQFKNKLNYYKKIIKKLIIQTFISTF